MEISLESVLSLLGLGGYVIAGIFATRGMWDSAAKTKREESDRLADGLIQRLQQTVDQQSKDLEKMQADMKEHTEKRDKEVSTLRDEVKHLQGRNGVLEDLFKGRDPAMQAFFKDAPKLFEIAHENNGLAKESSEALTNLTQTMAHFVDSLQPLLIHLELKKPEKAGV